MCATHRRKRALLQQPLFRTFYRPAHAHFGPGDFLLIASRAGFRGDRLRLRGRTVAIRPARLHAGAAPVRRYVLSAPPAADFVYYHLTGDDFLFVPTGRHPPAGATFRDDSVSALERFRKTFAAFSGEWRLPQAS